MAGLGLKKAVGAAMQAPDDGAGGANGGAGAPAGPRGPGEAEGCDGTAAEGTVAGGASELEGASPAPRHGEDASALASGEASGSQLLELYPFEGAPGTGRGTCGVGAGGEWGGSGGGAEEKAGVV